MWNKDSDIGEGRYLAVRMAVRCRPVSIFQRGISYDIRNRTSPPTRPGTQVESNDRDAEVVGSVEFRSRRKGCVGDGGGADVGVDRHSS